MRLVPISLQTLNEAVQILRRGGIIAHPADTCFGLAGDFANPEALKKLQAIKGRSGVKPMSIMLPAPFKDRLEEYAVLNEFTRAICEKLLPGPVTILLPKGPRIPKWYFPETDLIGIRIPYDPFTQDLLNTFKGPLITTSANFSGETVCCRTEELLQIFKEQNLQPDLLVEGSISKNHCLPSTVILPEKKHLKIVREGPMQASQLKTILGVKIA